jgi:hypothetical protein
MKVICIDDIGPVRGLTIGKAYKVLRETVGPNGAMYFVIDDRGYEARETIGWRKL